MKKKRRGRMRGIKLSPTISSKPPTKAKKKRQRRDAGEEGSDVHGSLPCCFDYRNYSSTETLFNAVKESVWILRVDATRDMSKGSNKDDSVGVYDSCIDNSRLPYIYASGVCVSGDGIILSSSQLLSSCAGGEVTGHPISGNSFKTLKVLHVDTKFGFAVLRAKEKSTYVYASLSSKFIEPRCSVMIIGHPRSIQFLPLKGNVTHECRFELDNLDDERAIWKYKTYLSVKDVLGGCPTLLLDKKLGLKLQLKESETCPLLAIEDIIHRNGLSGGPVFDNKGSVLGLVWFGDAFLTYGIPAQCIIHSILALGGDSDIRISIDEKNLHNVDKAIIDC